MVNLKRMLVILCAVAITVAGWGVLTVGASNNTPSGTTSAQTDQTAYLGVHIRDTNDAVMVWEVDPGSPADEAGIYIGDLIVAVDGQEVASASDLVQMIQSHAPGDEVSLTLEWRGEARDVSVTLAETPASPMTQIQPPANNNNNGNRPGNGNGRTNRQPFTGMLNLMGLNATWQSDGTLLINSIAADLPFAGTDLQAGDKIVAINGNKLDQTTDLMPRGLLDLFNFNSDQPVTFTIERDGQQMDVDVTLTMPMYDNGNGTDNMPGLGFGGMVAGQPTQLGVRFRTLTPQVAQDEGLSVQDGAEIVEVYPGTPAEAAGLQANDIIVSVDGDAVDQQHTLAERLAAYQEGDEVTFSVLRGSDTIEVKVTLGPRATNQMQMPYGFFGPGMGGGMNNMPDGHWFYFGPNNGQNTNPNNNQQAQPGNRGDAMLPLEQFLQAHPFLRDFMDQNGSGLDFQTIPVPEQVVPQPVVPDAQSSAA